MFRKREKKIFPPGTFISTPARVVAIIHLCLAFSLFLWILSQPFMGDLFAIKSEMVLYESLFSKQDLMQALSSSEIKEISQQYELLKTQLQLPFFDKLSTMMHLLFIKTPPLKLAWLFFSFVIPLMLLLRIEGAPQICWLLPVIVLAYSLDNQFNAPSRPVPGDYILFPKEETLVQEYLQSPLSQTILEQRKQLKEGWNRYLIQQWAYEKPLEGAEGVLQQLEKAEFAFTLARVKARSRDKILAIDKDSYKQSPILLGCYLFWNCLFASIAIRFLISRHLETSCAAIGAPSFPNPPNRK